MTVNLDNGGRAGLSDRGLWPGLAVQHGQVKAGTSDRSVKPGWPRPLGDHTFRPPRPLEPIYPSFPPSPIPKAPEISLCALGLVLRGIVKDPTTIRCTLVVGKEYPTVQR